MRLIKVNQRQTTTQEAKQMNESVLTVTFALIILKTKKNRRLWESY